MSKHKRLAQNRALHLSKDDSCTHCLSLGNRGQEEGGTGDHELQKKMAGGLGLFRVDSPRLSRQDQASEGGTHFSSTSDSHT